jgi:hypothetical protein
MGRSYIESGHCGRAIQTVELGRIEPTASGASRPTRDIERMIIGVSVVPESAPSSVPQRACSHYLRHAFHAPLYKERRLQTALPQSLDERCVLS